MPRSPADGTALALDRLGIARSTHVQHVLVLQEIHIAVYARSGSWSGRVWFIRHTCTVYMYCGGGDAQHESCSGRLVHTLHIHWTQIQPPVEV